MGGVNNLSMLHLEATRRSLDAHLKPNKKHLKVVFSYVSNNFKKGAFVIKKA